MGDSVSASGYEVHWNCLQLVHMTGNSPSLLSLLVKRLIAALYTDDNDGLAKGWDEDESQLCNSWRDDKHLWLMDIKLFKAEVFCFVKV